MHIQPMHIRFSLPWLHSCKSNLQGCKAPGTATTYQGKTDLTLHSIVICFVMHAQVLGCSPHDPHTLLTPLMTMPKRAASWPSGCWVEARACPASSCLRRSSCLAAMLLAAAAIHGQPGSTMATLRGLPLQELPKSNRCSSAPD